jgi:hypothetical protein
MSWRYQPATLYFVGAAFLMVALRTLAAADARGRWSVLAWIVAGGVARMVFAPVTLLGMSNYERVPSVFEWFRRHGINLHAAFPDGLDRWEEIHAVNLLLACMLPLLVFIHARLVFEDDRIASRASLLAAMTPIPIYFAQSDVMFIWSMAISSVCLILLHAAHRARTEFGDVLYGLAAFLTLDGVLEARQLNFFFGGVAVLSTSEILAQRPSHWWLKLWIPLVMLFVSLEYFWHMAVALAGGATDPLVVLRTITDQGEGSSLVWRLLWTNNFLFPTTTPLGFTVLVVLGAWDLWRRHRARWVYVVGWFVMFYVGHGILTAWNTTAMCRYGLHTIIPLCFFAGVGIGTFWNRFGMAWWAERAQKPAWMKLAVAAVLIFTTWLGFGLFREPVSDVQQEYAFLRSLMDRGIIEPGATIVESYGDADRHIYSGDFFAIRARPRFQYFGVRVEGGELKPTFRTSTGPIQTDGPLYLYEGLPCFWRTPGGQQISDSCRDARADLTWDPVETLEITGIRHDFSNGRDAKGKVIGLYRASRK